MLVPAVLRVFDSWNLILRVEEAGVTSVEEFEQAVGRLQRANRVGSSGLELCYRGEPECYPSFLQPRVCRMENDPWVRHTGRDPQGNGYVEFRRLSEGPGPLPAGVPKVAAPVRTRVNASPDIPGLDRRYEEHAHLLGVTRDPLKALFFACWRFDAPDEPPWSMGGPGIVYLVWREPAAAAQGGNGTRSSRDLEQGRLPVNGRNGDPGELVGPPAAALPAAGDAAPRRGPGGARFQARIRAQEGDFLFWQPPCSPYPLPWVPVPVSGEAKPALLRQLRDRGIQPNGLYPDPDGASMSRRLSKHLAHLPD